jgi:hypothetical protein
MVKIIKFDDTDDNHNHQKSTMSSNEYLLSKIAELQNRLSMVENSVIVLQQTIKPTAHLSYSQSLKTSIPLGPHHDATRRPMFQPRDGAQDQEQEPSMSLSELLTDGEVVTFSIIKGKDEHGNLMHSTLDAEYKDAQLTVTSCLDIPTLENIVSSKPGEILYKFMFALKERGIINRTFQALPWRLCSVLRDGQRVTLAQLRRFKQENPA